MSGEGGPPVVILASASPRRCELLTQIGIRFEQQVADLDESRRDNEGVRDYVRRVALDKARAVRAAGATLPVLGADTAVAVDERVFGKPVDRADGLAMLRALSGREHRVLSAVALAGEGESVAVSVTRVWFRPLEEQEIGAYWSTGEPRDKAGAYAIQGRGAVFIERIDGSYSGVMGLPLFETAQLLKAAGIGKKLC
jgi:septum formation protein